MSTACSIQRSGLVEADFATSDPGSRSGGIATLTASAAGIGSGRVPDGPERSPARRGVSRKAVTPNAAAATNLAAANPRRGGALVPWWAVIGVLIARTSRCMRAATYRLARGLAREQDEQDNDDDRTDRVDHHSLIRHDPSSVFVAGVGSVCHAHPVMITARPGQIVPAAPLMTRDSAFIKRRWRTAEFGRVKRRPRRSSDRRSGACPARPRLRSSGRAPA